MSEPTYNVLFKVLRIESPALVSGASYSLGWRRGTYRGNSPPYPCDSGVVDMSGMPQAAAVVHFKPNESGSKGRGKFQSKYLTFNIEENARGRQNIVGMLEFDIANCLRGDEVSCRVIKEAGFRMSGLGARIEVEVILFPEGTRPPVAPSAEARLVEGSERSTAAPIVSASSAANSSGVTARTPAPLPTGRVTGSRRKLSRDEALTLLLSIEGLLEQSGTGAAQAQYSGEDAATLDKQISDLEQRVQDAQGRLNAKKMIQHAALSVATAASLSYPAAQFRQLEDTPDAKQFVVDVTQYLDASYRQHAATRSASAPDSTLSTLPEINARIESLRQDLVRLQHEQEELSRLQLRRDVSDEAIRLLGRIQAKEEQLAKLQKHKEGLVQQLASNPSATATPSTAWDREKSSILEDIGNLHKRRETLQQVANSASTIYASRVGEWANRRFAPMREYDRLHKEIQQREEAESKEKKQKQLQKQILDLFGDMESGPAPAASAPPVAPDNEPPRREPATQTQGPVVDAFETLYDAVPKTTDFGPSATNRGDSQGSSRASSQNPTEYAFTQPVLQPAEKAPDEKKNAFADLGAAMFASSDSPAATASVVQPAKAVEFNFGGEENSNPSFTKPSRAELKGAYTFGNEHTEETTASAPSAATTARPFASEYTFGSADGASANAYTFGATSHADPTPPTTMAASSDGVGLWGTPLEMIAAARRPQLQKAREVSDYSFGPAEGESASSTTTYRPSNIFATFDD